MHTLTLLATLGLFAVCQEFKPSQTFATGGFRLEAPIADVFPMFEPIGEKRWAPGWNPTPIYPPDIKPQAGTVFETFGSKGSPSIWTITQCDPGHRIEYTVVTPGHDVTQIKVVCTGIAARLTDVSVSYRMTGLSQSGNEFGKEHKAKFDSFMHHWKVHIDAALQKGRH